MIISKINNLASEPKDLGIEAYVTYVETGVTQDLILKIRTEKDKDKRTELKKGLPAVIFGGVFKGNRQKSSLVEKTGYIGLDIDDLDVSELNQVRKTLENDQYSMIVNVSAGGKGFCVVVKYKVANDFSETFAAIEKYYAETYGIVLDTACKDVNRLRFISYDPDIFHNTKSKTWTKIFKEENVKKHDKIIFVKSDFDEIIKEVQTKNIDLSDDDYAKYRSLGFAISDAFGENGRDYFHIICQAGGKYKVTDTDRHYTNFCKAKGHGITISTFYHFCKEKGVSTYSEQTKTIIKQAARGKRQGTDVESIVDHLEKFEDVGIEQSKEIIEQVYNSNFNFVKAIQLSEDKNDTEIIAEFIIEEFNLKQNEITRNLEKNGVAMKTRDLNSCYIDTKIALGDTNVFRGDFDSILFSDRTPIYNPIVEFLKEHEETEIKEDLIKTLSETFEVSSKEQALYNYSFIKKWFVGMVGTALKKEVSPLSLVLCGDVQGTGKTEWYRRLLPSDLKSLYAESKLDAGKDDEILMTQKILIMDDEFGGKSKKDEKRFKEITSKQIFNLREPYGKANVDLERLATLCGTTNEIAILSDPTGNRRLLPILIKTINHKLYNSIDKDLLFVQAYREIQKGFDYSLTKKEIKLLNDSTSEFEQVDQVEELFQLYFSDDSSYGNLEYLTNTEILARIQNISNMKTGTSKRLGQILKKLGFKQLTKRINGTPKKVYEVYSINRKPVDPFPFQEPTF